MMLVFGVVGGVGLVVIEIGKVIGVCVIVVVLSDEKFVVCKDYGVDVFINYLIEDLCECIKELIDGKGLDVIYDLVGGIYVELVFCLIVWCGCYFVVGFVNGEILKMLLNLVLFKGVLLVGVFWGEFVCCELKVNLVNMM